MFYTENQQQPNQSRADRMKVRRLGIQGINPAQPGQDNQPQNYDQLAPVRSTVQATPVPQTPPQPMYDMRYQQGFQQAQQDQARRQADMAELARQRQIQWQQSQAQRQQQAEAERRRQLAQQEEVLRAIFGGY